MDSQSHTDISQEELEFLKAFAEYDEELEFLTAFADYNEDDSIHYKYVKGKREPIIPPHQTSKERDEWLDKLDKEHIRNLKSILLQETNPWERSSLNTDPSLHFIYLIHLQFFFSFLSYIYIP